MIRHDVARARLAILLILLSLTVSTAAAAGDPIFATASSYDSGGKTAASAASGDFNNDGKLDVAIANQCIRSADCASGSVSVTARQRQRHFSSRGELFLRWAGCASCSCSGRQP